MRVKIQNSTEMVRMSPKMKSIKGSNKKLPVIAKVSVGPPLLYTR